MSTIDAVVAEDPWEVLGWERWPTGWWQKQRHRTRGFVIWCGPHEEPRTDSPLTKGFRWEDLHPSEPRT